MSEMIERVAHALAKLNYEGRYEWPQLSIAEKDLYRKDARTAIEAMREPTVAMMDAGHGYCDSSHNARSAFRAMIDAALQEPKP